MMVSSTVGIQRSHPTVNIAIVGPNVSDVSDGLGSSSNEPLVRMIILRVHLFVLRLLVLN